MLVNAASILCKCRNLRFKNVVKRTLTSKGNQEFDVVVVGGGAIGSSIAYWLKHMCSNQNFKVAVIEKDFTYSKCSTVLSVGGIRQQFSLAENIQMSTFGIEFIKTLKNRFGSEADISFTPNGYLILASSEGAQQLDKSFQLQRSLGASSELFSKTQLKERFPWLDVTGVELGCLGVNNSEGWFDPWALLNLFKNRARTLGAKFIQGEATDFSIDLTNQQLQGVKVKLPNGNLENINFQHCVLAAGAESGNLAKLMQIGQGDGDLKFSLPVERRKRYVYRFDCQAENPPKVNSPLMIDYTGVYFRRDGNCYIGGQSPLPEDEPETKDLEVDFNFFDEKVWPLLAQRIPAFNNIKVKSAWGGFYEYNTFDENGIIGPHNFYKNLFLATGFSGHGIQQSPAVGRAISELILDGSYKSINLGRLGFERFVKNEPMYEVGIY